MYKALIVIIGVFLSGCSYSYLESGNYEDINPKYKFKNKKTVKLNYDIPVQCETITGFRYCSNWPERKKVKSVFKEYNLEPDDSYKYENVPVLSVHHTKNTGATIVWNGLCLMTVGIIPCKSNETYEVKYKKDEYEVTHREKVTSYMGWFMIPFANEKPATDYLGNVMKATINDTLKNKKIN